MMENKMNPLISFPGDVCTDIGRHPFPLSGCSNYTANPKWEQESGRSGLIDGLDEDMRGANRGTFV